MGRCWMLPWTDDDGGGTEHVGWERDLKAHAQWDARVPGQPGLGLNARRLTAIWIPREREEQPL